MKKICECYACGYEKECDLYDMGDAGYYWLCYGCWLAEYPWGVRI